MTKASGTFTVGGWDESPDDATGGEPDVARAAVTFRYAGDLDGEGRSSMLMSYAGGSPGSAGYLGYERITGRLAGREGSFVVEIAGTFADDTARAAWRIVPGSGRGALTGITGEGGGESTKRPEPYTWWLDYELPASD